MSCNTSGTSGGASGTRVEMSQDDSEWPVYVNGRLGLTGVKKKYRVTLREVKRRTSPPEFMSATAVCQYLKRSRQKTSLPTEIVVPRKARTRNSLFTLLTGEESTSLAKDFSRITKDEGFFKNLLLHPFEDARIVRNAVEKMLDRLDSFNEMTDRANLLTHGFSMQVVRTVLDQIF